MIQNNASNYKKKIENAARTVKKLHCSTCGLSARTQEKKKGSNTQKTGQQTNAKEHKVINIISTNNRKQHRKRYKQEEDDASLVVTLYVSHYTIKRVLVDMGSAANVLFKDAFDQLDIPLGNIKPRTTPLIGFTRRSISSIGSTRFIEFLIVDAPSSYSGI